MSKKVYLKSGFNLLLIAACMLALFVNCQKEENKKDNENELPGWDHYLWKFDPDNEFHFIDFMGHNKEMVLVKVRNYVYSKSKLMAIKIDDGSIAWVKDGFEVEYFWGTVDLKDDVVVFWGYLPDSNGQNQLNPMKITALDMRNGGLLWEKHIASKWEAKRYDDKLFFTRALASGGWIAGLCWFASGEMIVEAPLPLKDYFWEFTKGGLSYFVNQTTETTLNPQFSLLELDPRNCSVVHLADFDLNDPLEQGVEKNILISNFIYFQYQSAPYLAVSFQVDTSEGSKELYLKVIDLENVSNQWVDRIDLDPWLNLKIVRFENGKLACKSSNLGSSSYNYHYYDLRSREFWETSQAAIPYHGIYMEEYDLYFFSSSRIHPHFEIRDKNGDILWTGIGVSGVSISDGWVYLDRFPGLAKDIYTGETVCNAFPQDICCGPPEYQYSRSYGIAAVPGLRGRRVLYAIPSSEIMPGQIVCYEVCSDNPIVF